jgi:hypothetical protein
MSCRCWDAVCVLVSASVVSWLRSSLGVVAGAAGGGCSGVAMGFCYSAGEWLCCTPVCCTPVWLGQQVLSC